MTTVETIDGDITLINTHFKDHYNNTNDYQRLLSQVVKLNEEVGEMCEAVLHENNEQRIEKTDIDLGSEIADVIICALMIAKTKDVAVWTEIDKKISKIKNRHGL